MNFTINNFTVNKSSGYINPNGTYTEQQINDILSHATIINGEKESIEIPGTPYYISSGSLYKKAHMCTSYIKIVNEYCQCVDCDCVIVLDKFIRISFIGGTTSAQLSLIYGFTNSKDTPISNISWNVLIAHGNAQTKGDYWDICLPDPTYYPELYIAFILLNNSWKYCIKTDNYYTMKDTLPNFCIDPSKSITDSNHPSL